MKKFIGILLILLILASSLRDLITFASFKANQDYIANHLCINRFDEIPTCKGSCFLQQAINEDHENDLDGNSAPNLQHRVELVYVVNHCMDFTPNISLNLTTPALISEPFYLDNNYTSGVFRPPIFLS